MKKKDKMEGLKMEAAEELGLADKLRRTGWGGLTSEETGRIGAVVRKRKHRSIGGVTGG
jgi:small acid-soluble spore protein F (minor alpha/beta-type SASP)